MQTPAAPLQCLPFVIGRDMPKIFSRAFFAHTLVYLLYLLVAVVITWPLVTVFSTQLVGHPFGDSYEYVRHIWWIKHALQTGQPIFDQPLLAYPDGLTGAWLWGNPLQSFPAWLFAFIMLLPAAFNLSVLLTLALNGWTMYWLLWHLTDKNRGAAILAGLVFLAAPTFQGQLGAGHTGLLVLWPVPLYIYGLVRLKNEPNLRWLIWSAVFFVVSLWGNMLLIVFLVAPVTALFALMRLVERDWRGLAWMLGAAGLGALLSLIFILPVARETLNTPAIQESNEVRYSADLLSIVTPSFYHPIFKNLDYTHKVLGIEPFERVGYIGIIAGVLVIVAVWKEKRARWWLLLAIIAWVFSLGPILKVFDQVVTINLGEYESYVTFPWLIFHNLPLLNLTRTPARFNMVVALAVAIMVGYGTAYLWRLVGARLTRAQGFAPLQWIALILVMVAAIYEYQFFWPLPTIPGTVPEAVQAISQRDDVRAVFDMPWFHLLVDKDGLFLQTGHQHPMIAGHVTRRTPVNPSKLTILQETLDYALLDAAGVDIVIIHKQWDESNGALETFTRSRFGQPFYEDDRIAVFEVPPPLNAPEFVAVPAKEPEISDQIDSFLYAPESGWATLSGNFESDSREMALYLDGELAHRWRIDGMQQINLPLPVSAGYHTVTLKVEPPCPLHFDETLECRSIQVRNLALENFTPALLDQPAQFDRGLELAGAMLSPSPRELSVSLWWRFDQPRNTNEIRFIHVLNAEGINVAQTDSTLGDQPAGGQWIENISIPLPDDLPAGEYTVYTGWYTLPDVVRFPVLSDVPGVQDRLVELGKFRTEG